MSKVKNLLLSHCEVCGRPMDEATLGQIIAGWFMYPPPCRDCRAVTPLMQDDGRN